jgi:hypothetical protein
MFDALEAAVLGLEVPGSPGAVAEALRLRDLLDAKVTVAVGALDASEAWGLDGSVSCAAWLRQHTGMTPAQAKRATVTAARVRRSPALQAGWVEGRLTSGQVDVVVQNVTDELVELWEQHEAAVVPTLEALPIRDTAVVMQTWAMRAKVQLGLDGPEPDRPDSLHCSRTLDGRGRLDGNLSSEVQRDVATALDLATSRDTDGEARTPAQRRHDALGAIARWYIDHQTAKVGGRKRPHVSVVIDLDALRHDGPGRDFFGRPIAPPAIQAVLCDANVHRVLRAGSAILDYGRATRTIPPAVYESLYLRDLGCRFPGCDRPGEWCEGHHIVFWEHGGETNLPNLVLLCSRHHHLIHHPGWHLKLLPTGTVEVTAPDGTLRTSDPPRVGPR